MPENIVGDPRETVKFRKKSNIINTGTKREGIRSAVPKPQALRLRSAPVH